MRHFWTWAFRGKPASSWPGEGFRQTKQRFSSAYVHYQYVLGDDLDLWWSLMIMILVPNFQSKDSLVFSDSFPKCLTFNRLIFPMGPSPEESRIDHSYLWKFLHLFLFADCHWWNIHFFPWLFHGFSMGIRESTHQDFHILGSTNLYGPIDDIF